MIKRQQDDMESEAATRRVQMKLLDCPFCGNAAVLTRKTKIATVSCVNCPAELSVDELSGISVQALWNRRACECFGQNSLDHPEDWGMPPRDQSQK